MKNIVRFIIASSLCLFSITIFAGTKSLSNYDELLQALDGGKKVRAIIHADKCKLASGGGLPVISGGFDFDIYNHYNMPIDATHFKEVISTSKSVFSITNIEKLGPVTNYLRLHVFKDNTAQLTGVLLDPKTYETKVTATYVCPISSDASQAGLLLYSQSE